MGNLHAVNPMRMRVVCMRVRVVPVRAASFGRMMVESESSRSGHSIYRALNIVLLRTQPSFALGKEGNIPPGSKRLAKIKA